MTSKQSAAEIERIAADWVAREDRRELSGAEAAERDAWLAADPRAQGAYVRAHAAWAMMDRGRAMADGEPPKRRWPAVTRREAMAAGLVGVAGLGGALAFTRFAGARYRTARGEILRVPLADGSSAAINTASRVQVSMSDDLRAVKLEQGEVWFDVTPDEARPFLVQAADVRVKASAGAFAVRHLAEGAEVIVSKGTVECWSTRDPGRLLTLPAGSRMVFARSEPRAVRILSPTTVSRLLAWREGMVGLDGETLAEAAAEFNRYNDRRILIDDPAVGSERLVGIFRANDPESFVRAAGETLGVPVQVGERELRIGG